MVKSILLDKAAEINRIFKAKARAESNCLENLK